jgi:hypothetical protein
VKFTGDKSILKSTMDGNQMSSTTRTSMTYGELAVVPAAFETFFVLKKVLNKGFGGFIGL